MRRQADVSADERTLDEILASIRRLLAESDEDVAEQVLKATAPPSVTLSSGALVIEIWGNA